MLLTPVQFFVDLRAGQDGRFSNRKYGRSPIFNAGGETLISLEPAVKFLGDQDGVYSKHMFVESCIFDVRSRATRSEQMLNNTAFYSMYANNKIYD